MTYLIATRTQTKKTNRPQWEVRPRRNELIRSQAWRGANPVMNFYDYNFVLESMGVTDCFGLDRGIGHNTPLLFWIEFSDQPISFIFHWLINNICYYWGWSSLVNTVQYEKTSIYRRPSRKRVRRWLRQYKVATLPDHVIWDGYFKKHFTMYNYFYIKKTTIFSW